MRHHAAALRAAGWRVDYALEEVCRRRNVPLEWLEDTHFYCSRRDSRDWVRGRKSLVMEFFYREMRRRSGILMERGAPVGGRWNFDKDNRGSSTTLALRRR
jgi:deoxyribodipyrimidine photolyase-related protein